LSIETVSKFRAEIGMKSCPVKCASGITNVLSNRASESVPTDLNTDVTIALDCADV